VEYWLNRYQTLIGIGGALFAASIATRPVWRQLDEMRTQSAVQAYAFLQQLLQIVEIDGRLTWKVKATAGHAIIAEKYAKDIEEPFLLEGLLSELEKQIAALGDVRSELEIAGTNPWGSAVERIARSKVAVEISVLMAAISNSRKDIHLIFTENHPVIIPSKWAGDKTKLSQDARLTSAASSLDMACDDYLQLIESERSRLRPLVTRARDQAFLSA
jgi:hypothetical protein